jgi:hypothetical protein
MTIKWHVCFVHMFIKADRGQNSIASLASLLSIPRGARSDWIMRKIIWMNKREVEQMSRAKSGVKRFSGGVICAHLLNNAA